MKNLSYNKIQKLKEFLSNIEDNEFKKEEIKFNQEKYKIYLLSIFLKSIEIELIGNLNIFEKDVDKLFENYIENYGSNEEIESNISKLDKIINTIESKENIDIDKLKNQIESNISKLDKIINTIESKENIDIYNKSLLDEEKLIEDAAWKGDKVEIEELFELINSNDFKGAKTIKQFFNNIYEKINSTEFVLNKNSVEPILESLAGVDMDKIIRFIYVFGYEKDMNIKPLKDFFIEDINKIKLIINMDVMNEYKLIDNKNLDFYINKIYELQELQELQNEIFNNANNDFFLMEEKIIKFFELQIDIKNIFYIDKLNLLLKYKKITSIEDFINFIFLLFIFINRNEFDTYLNINNFFEIIIERFEELYDEIYDEKNSYIIANIINYLSNIYRKKDENNFAQINKFYKFNFDIDELNKNNIYFNKLEKLIDFKKIELSLEYLEIILENDFSSTTKAISDFKNNKKEIYNVLELIEEIIFNNLDKEEFINFFNDRKIDI